MTKNSRNLYTMEASMNDSLNENISNIHEKDIQLLTGICSLEEGIGEILRRLENKTYYLPVR